MAERVKITEKFSSNQRSSFDSNKTRFIDQGEWDDISFKSNNSKVDKPIYADKVKTDMYVSILEEAVSSTVENLNDPKLRLNISDIILTNISSICDKIGLTKVADKLMPNTPKQIINDKLNQSVESMTKSILTNIDENREQITRVAPVKQSMSDASIKKVGDHLDKLQNESKQTQSKSR